MPTEAETITYASSHGSFYEFLGIATDAQQSDIRRAYRKTSLKYHPDQNPDPSAVEKFHLLTIANEILNDAALRAAYDNALNARQAKKRRSEALDSNRKKMKDDLEAREKTADKLRMEELERKREFDRLKEEGAKLRAQMDEKKRKQAEEEEAGNVMDVEDSVVEETMDTQTSTSESKFSDTDLTVRVKWRKKGRGETLDQSDLNYMFSRFGVVEYCAITPSSSKQVQKEKEKKYRSAAIKYGSIVHAYAAVHRDQKALENEDERWSLFKEVVWYSGREPDLGLNFSLKPDTPAATATATVAAAVPSFSPAKLELDQSSTDYNSPGPDFKNFRSSTNSVRSPFTFSTPNNNKSSAQHGASTPLSSTTSYKSSPISAPNFSSKSTTTTTTSSSRLKSVPSFASFKASPSASNNTPQQSPLKSTTTATGGASGTDYEDITLIKMRARAAEKRRLEEEIRKKEQLQDQAEDNVTE